MTRQTNLHGVYEFSPVIYEDIRGYNFELGRPNSLPFFVEQENISFSKKHTLRGLHFQVCDDVWQQKIVRCLSGVVFDVVVDVVKSSPTYGKYYFTYLNGRKHNALMVPAGYAHGFYALEDSVIHYYMSEPYQPDYQHTLLWSDPELPIVWPFCLLDAETLKVSDKDKEGKLLKDLCF